MSAGNFLPLREAPLILEPTPVPASPMYIIGKIRTRADRASAGSRSGDESIGSILDGNSIETDNISGKEVWGVSGTADTGTSRQAGVFRSVAELASEE